MFQPLHFTRRVPKCKDEEETNVELFVNKNQLCLLKQLHTYTGPPHGDKFCRISLSILSADNELQKGWKFCSEIDFVSEGWNWVNFHPSE